MLWTTSKRGHVAQAIFLAVLAPAMSHAEPPRSPQPPPRVPQLDCTVTTEQGYRRGKKFSIKVIAVDGRPLELATANAYWAMQLAAARDGVTLQIFSGFRSHADQSYFYRCFRTCSCNACNPAARPGYSKHQSGRALDIAQWIGVRPWLVKNARRFGFYATVRREPWHWEFRPPRRARRGRRWPRACATFGR